MSSEKKSSPWLWIGCGCLLAILLLVGGVAGCGYLGFNRLKNFQEEMTDPDARDRKAERMLGGGGIPNGYRSQLAIGVPFFFDLVVLSDGEILDLVEQPSFDGLTAEQVGEHVFSLVEFKRGEWELEDVASLFDGREKDGVSIDPGFRFGSLEELESGSLDLPETSVEYSLRRGELSGVGDVLSGTMAMLSIDCAGDDRSRLGVWFRRDGDLGLSEATLSAEEVSSFLSSMALCD